VFESLLNAFRAPDIRRRILYVLGILIVFRFLASVPLPGSPEFSSRLPPEQPDLRTAEPVLGRWSGTTVDRGAGYEPYINASIIMQLMTGVIPSLRPSAAKVSTAGTGSTSTRAISRSARGPCRRTASCPVERAGRAHQRLRLGNFVTVTQIATLTAGAIVLMWLGELITEKGIGNGISFIIFAGIVSSAPGAINAFLINPNPTAIVFFGIVAIAAVAVIIYIQEGQRRIPIQYASRVRGRRMYQGGQTFLPLRVNQAGVIPIIFAISILLFPQQIASYFTTSSVKIVADIATAITTFFNPNTPLYFISYFLLVVGFTYFYTAFTFKRTRQPNSCARTVGSSRHPPRAADAGLSRAGGQPHHVRGRDVPGHRRGLATGGRRGPAGRRHARPGRNEPAHRGVRCGRNDETDRSAAHDAQLRRLHPVRAAPVAAHRFPRAERRSRFT
jgi:preprotein translocase subunit SecY